jgi:glycine cleavage system H protein
MAKPDLPTGPPKGRRWINTSMSGLVLATLVAYAVLGSGLLYLALSESTESFAVESDFSRRQLAIWCTVGGIAALALGLGCLRLGLFKSLASVVSLCFFVFVVGFSVLLELKEGGDATGLAARTIAPWQPFALIVIASSIVWCLQKARRKSSMSGRPARGIGITACVSAGLMLFAVWVWVFGLGTSTSQQHSEAQATAPTRQEPTWENIRRIIANELNVPEEQVVPAARFEVDLNAAAPDMEEMVESFENVFGIDRQDADADMLITVQDAIDYVRSPKTFRTEHRGQSRYASIPDPYPTDVRYSKAHEWVKVEGNEASIGLTRHAQQIYALIWRVDLPEVGTKISVGGEYATVDVGMSSTGLIAPVSGIVTDINRELASSAQSIDKDPYAAWIIKVELADPAELKTLLSAADYAKFVDAGN